MPTPSNSSYRERRPDKIDVCPNCGGPKSKKSRHCWECMRTVPLRVAVQPEDPSIRHIPLTRGQIAVVDADNYEWLNGFHWHAIWSPPSQGYYASRWRIENGVRTLISMHRQVMGIEPMDQRLVDHIAPNSTLVNTRANLRFADHFQNAWNRKIANCNTSGFKGVNWHSHTKKWVARVTVNNKRISLGYFKTPEEAAAKRISVLADYHGEFARSK